MPPRTAAPSERLIPRYRQLACEVLFQVVQDVKALNRRGYLRGLTRTGKEGAGYKCLGYREPAELDEFVASIRGEPVRVWLKAADVDLTHQRLVSWLEGLTPETSKPLTINRKEVN
jgi:hypothetical protein